MSYKVFFDGPENYQNRFSFYTQGSSPRILKNFISLIEENKKDLVEINLCWYLFNNAVLHEFLKDLSLSGIKVNVVTIPLEGYDASNARVLIDLNGKDQDSEPVTKYDLAKGIFREMYKPNNYSNYNIYFFPHIYVRSSKVKPFSRGTLPYSMHLKAAYIKKRNGAIIALSSSNLAVRDLVKYESMLVIENEPDFQDNFRQFFFDIVSNSIHIKNYNSGYDTSANTFNFIKSLNNLNSFFSAPFYFDSANILEEKLESLISKAHNRIIICAQHLAAFNYDFNASFHSMRHENKQRPGILGAIIAKAKKGIKTTCVSQTFVPPDNKAAEFKGVAFRKPANTRNFQRFYDELSNTKNAEYYVNQNVHSKYLIIDDTLIFCTYNFTPTQFIFLDAVAIDKFEQMPDFSYNGVHCEVSGHVVVRDTQLVHSFLENVKAICHAPETIKVL